MTDPHDQELTLARVALRARRFDAAFIHLERAHVLGQRRTWRHVRVHGLMLLGGWQRGDLREVLGQLPRALAALLFSRVWVPPGNTGRSRVGAFTPMPIPEDLRRHLDLERDRLSLDLQGDSTWP